ncbi:MAG: HAMP domain-containing histidine kinase [Candidatus Brocadiae bacterium]|nr:HAMP domain-containing histidine kinase [Candidatus Brocadiia bacterium]
MNRSQVKKSWQDYRDQNLRDISQSIQGHFYEMERLSFSVLDEMLLKTSILQEITYTNPSEGSLKIFQALNEFSFPMDLNRRGIAVYNHLRQCIAWKNCDFNPAPHLLEECLKGERFSTIVKSGRGVFVVLCTFVPIPHPKLREYIGVAVCFLPLDSNYPLSTRYIKSQSFAQKMLQEYPVQDISISYEVLFSTSPLAENSMQRSLQSVNGQQLGSLILTSLPQDTTLQSLKKKRNGLLQINTCFFLFFLFAYICFQSYKIGIAIWKQNLLAIFLLILLRAIWFAFHFPNQILPSYFSSPNVFHSLIFSVWSDSLGNLLITCLLFFIVSRLLLIQTRVCSWDMGKHKSFLFSCLAAILFCLFFSWGNQFLYTIVYSLVKHASFPLFDFTNLTPNFDSFILYICILLLAFSFFFFSISLWNVWQKFQKSSLNSIFYLSGISFILVFAMELSPLCLWSVFFFSCAMIAYLYRFPKRYELFYIFLLFTVSFSVYPFLQYSAKTKTRALLQDKAEEFQESFIRHTLKESLDAIENSPELIRSLEQKKNDIAFLLWAKTDLSERLDNLELMVYSKNEENHKTAGTFQLFSQFSLNMPNPLWYRPLLQKVKNEQKQLLENLPGISPEGKNMLFYLASLPIHNSKDKIIASVVLITRYPQIAQSLPVPEVFAKKPTLASIPLLMANFENQNMFVSNNPYVSKNFKPSPQVIKEVQENQKNLWIEESIENCEYDNFYFLWVSKAWLESRKEWTTKETIGMIGYPLPSQITKIFHLLQFFVSGFAFFLAPLFLARILYHLLKQGISLNKIRLPFEYKILISFLLISGIPVFIMGILNKEKAISQIWESYAKNLTESLQNAEKAMREETYVPLTVDEMDPKMPNDDFCKSWGERNRSMLNVYLSSQPFLLATNRRELFYTELLPTRISGAAYYQLILEKKEIYITLESIADYNFVVGYKSLVSALDKKEIVGVISIPMIYRQSEVKREISEMMATVLTIYILIFFIVMVIGIILAHQITRPLAHLMKAIHSVSSGNLDIMIPITSKDEFGELVDSFNRMTKDLKTSRERLIQAEKDAAWREMARQIAHEIKNPLTPMKLSAQHIQRAYKDQAKNFDKILDKGISNIIDAIDSLSKTASSFSEFARFTKPTLAMYALEPLFSDCIELFAHYAEQNIHITAQIQPNLPKAITDPHQLKRVLFNLLTNAVQAIKNPPGQIVLACQKATEDSKKILITIQDNGSGIPENIKPHLFEPNFSTKTHGSGLGLAICKRAIDHMGGNISIQSQEGKGTQVVIALYTELPKSS